MALGPAFAVLDTYRLVAPEALKLVSQMVIYLLSENNLDSIAESAVLHEQVNVKC